MQKVYFDTNVYSDLRNRQEYAEFVVRLLDNKGQVLFFFSPAHIEDLKNDDTNNKYDDIDFITRFTDDNYLSINIINKGCNLFKRYPREVLAGAINATPQNANNVDPSEVLALRNIPQLQQYRVVFDSIEAMLEKVQSRPETVTPSSLFSEASQSAAEFLSELGIENKTYTAAEWDRVVSSLDVLLKDRPELYRTGRRIAKEELGIDKADAKIGSPNFDANLSKTKVGKSFTDVVKAVMEPIRSIPLFDHLYVEFTFSYFLLNLLGMDYEKNRSVAFANTLADAQHSYYGVNADYVVSSDAGFLSKTKFLYEMYGIETRVMSLREFAGTVDLFDDSVLDSSQLFQIILHDLRHGFVRRYYGTVDTGMTLVEGTLSYPLFSYFNEFMMRVDGEPIRVALYKRTGSVSQVQTFREVASVTNKAIKVLGVDVEFHGEFVPEEEAELLARKWRGRRWLISGIKTELCIDSGNGGMSFRIEFHVL